VHLDPFIDFWETVIVGFRPTVYGQRRMHRAGRVSSEITVFVDDRHRVVGPLIIGGDCTSRDRLELSIFSVNGPSLFGYF